MLKDALCVIAVLTYLDLWIIRMHDHHLPRALLIALTTAVSAVIFNVHLISRRSYRACEDNHTNAFRQCSSSNSTITQEEMMEKVVKQNYELSQTIYRMSEEHQLLCELRTAITATRKTSNESLYILRETHEGTHTKMNRRKSVTYPPSSHHTSSSSTIVQAHSEHKEKKEDESVSFDFMMCARNTLCHGGNSSSSSTIVQAHSDHKEKKEDESKSFDCDLEKEYSYYDDKNAKVLLEEENRFLCTADKGLGIAPSSIHTVNVVF